MNTPSDLRTQLVTLARGKLLSYRIRHEPDCSVLKRIAIPLVTVTTANKIKNGIINFRMRR